MNNQNNLVVSKKRVSRSYIVSFFSIGIGILLYGSVQLNLDAYQEPTVTLELLEPAPALEKNPTAVDPEISAIASIVLDEKSGSVLFEKNARTLYPPASTTKLMSALVVRESMNLKDTITFNSQDMSTGNLVGLRIGETLTVLDLLRAALISSGNDATLALANNYEAGNTAFVERMNQKARELDLQDTSFTNAVGFDSPTHQTTARDLGLLAREALKDPILAQIVSTSELEIPVDGSAYTHKLYNTNQLLELPGIVGVKTGTTELAKQVLITAFTTESDNYIIVVLGSYDRYADTLELLDWTIENYEQTEIKL